MLDLRLIRDKPDEVRAALARRGAEVADRLEAVIALDRRRRLTGETTARAQRAQPRSEACAFLALLSEIDDSLRAVMQSARSAS